MNEEIGSLLTYLDSLLPPASTSAALVRSMRAELTTELTTSAGEDGTYTHSRAATLLRIASMMREKVIASSSAPYSDKAHVLSVVGDNYLKLVHAFKTDPRAWQQAQSDLVPVLTSTHCESDLDSALFVLLSHLDSYLASLSLWLQK